MHRPIRYKLQCGVGSLKIYFAKAAMRVLHKAARKRRSHQWRGKYKLQGHLSRYDAQTKKIIMAFELSAKTTERQRSNKKANEKCLELHPRVKLLYICCRIQVISSSTSCLISKEIDSTIRNARMSASNEAMKHETDKRHRNFPLSQQLLGLLGGRFGCY